jgi:hypothetical protein
VWRRAQEREIVAVVLRDLAQLPPDEHAPDYTPAAFCAFFGERSHGYVDPPATVLAKLSGTGVRVVAASDCVFPAFRLKATGLRAALIGVESIEWRRDDQVKVKAERGIGPLAGRGWLYTVSMTARGWEIDNATPTWIA